MASSAPQPGVESSAGAEGDASHAMDKTQASKFMSLILRHDPAAAGIALDANGWAVIDEMLAGMAA